MPCGGRAGWRLLAEVEEGCFPVHRVQKGDQVGGVLRIEVLLDAAGDGFSAGFGDGDVEEEVGFGGEVVDDVLFFEEGVTSGRLRARAPALLSSD